MKKLTDQRREELLRENLLNLLRTGAFEFIDRARPWFPYTSGQIGPYYVQSTAVEKDGSAYAAAISAIVELIRAEAPDFDAISGGESRDWDFSNPAAYALAAPHLKIYKDGKMLGADPAGKRVLHVADLNNEGSSIRDRWKPFIERRGGVLVGAVFFVDRLEEGVDVMRQLGLPHHAVVPLGQEAWRVARESGVLSEWAWNELLARSHDRDGWAEKALLANPEYFREFCRNPANREKAKKILLTYPRVREALSTAAAFREGDEG